MKQQLKNLLSLGFNEVEQQFYRGMIGQTTWEAYCRVWTWSAVRWSNVCQADTIQERFYTRYGKAAFYRRINRTRAAFGFGPVIA